jgi:hypothetical protein
MMCFWIFHSYTKWEDVTAYEKVFRHDTAPVGCFIVQHRRCERCGKLQSRRVDQ